MNSDRMYPELVGNHVVVRTPSGLPKLAMAVVKQILKCPAASELEAYSIVADYLESLMEDTTRKDDVIDLVTCLTKTDAERYMDGLMESGYTVEQLDQLARVIQRTWKRYKTRALKASEFAKLLELVQSYGQSLETANKTATIIQKAWRKHYCLIFKRPDPKTAYLNKQFKTDFLEEIDYEDDSDDMERVNVVKKGQRYYVPPIPDFIGDQNATNSFSMINVIDEFPLSAIEEDE